MRVYSDIWAVSSYLPEGTIDNAELAKASKWTKDEIFQKTGIKTRHIASPDECSSDLAAKAVEQLLVQQIVRPDELEFLVLCTQTPDYRLPATACLVQKRVELPTTCAAFDINLGCSAFIYALSVADSFIRSGRFERGLVVTSDTYSRYIHAQDRATRTIFGDAATATLVQKSTREGLGSFAFGTDGRGAENLIIRAGGTRQKCNDTTSIETEDASGNIRSEENLFMNGPEIFSFTLQRVPEVIRQTLQKTNLLMDQVDWFVFHQANQFMLDHLRKKLGLPAERMLGRLEDVGNTVSSTIPLVLEQAFRERRFKSGDRVMLVGFGVGYSWGAAMWYPR